MKIACDLSDTQCALHKVVREPEYRISGLCRSLHVSTLCALQTVGWEPEYSDYGLTLFPEG